MTKKVKLKVWLVGTTPRQELFLLQQLSRFISDVVLPNVEAEKVLLLIDEIDIVLSLDFSSFDFC